jgi:hypothetical protein
MVHCYNYNNSGRYPSPSLLFKAKRFGDWVLFPSSGLVRLTEIICLLTPAAYNSY